MKLGMNLKMCLPVPVSYQVPACRGFRAILGIFAICSKLTSSHEAYILVGHDRTPVGGTMFACKVCIPKLDPCRSSSKTRYR